MRTRHPLTLLLAAVGVVACTLVPVTTAHADVPGSQEDVAAGYYRILLEHTRWAETNACFHGAILRGSGNRQLMLSIEDISRRLPRNSSYPAYAGNSRLLSQNLAEHQAIAEAIVDRNAKKARAQMVKHIRSATESLARYVENSEHG